MIKHDSSFKKFVHLSAARQVRGIFNIRGNFYFQKNVLLKLTILQLSKVFLPFFKKENK